jgi:hypothetical protein
MRFAVVLPWWGYAAAFGAALLLGWLAYARVPVKLTPGRRLGLSALRALTLILLILILLRPIVVDSDGDWPRIIQPAADRVNALSASGISDGTGRTVSSSSGSPSSTTH